MQVLFSAMLIDAFHTAFEDRIVTFNGVGRDHALAFVTCVFVPALVLLLLTVEPPDILVERVRERIWGAGDDR